MKTKLIKRAKTALTQMMDLPADVIFELPRITLIGDIHIYIENYKSIQSFSSTELRLRITRGSLIVKGENFILKTILSEEILLEGKIIQLFFENN